MGFLGFNFDLIEQLTFYGSYHHDPRNQLVHVIFVPCIYWTALIWFCYTGEFAELSDPAPLGGYMVLNGSAILFAVYALYYLTLDVVVGFTFDCVLFGLYILANVVYQELGEGTAWWFALILHVLSWYMQIHVGHIVFEGRKPALFDSFFQSLVLAPLFVWFEVLFYFGFLKELRAKCTERIEANITEWKASTENLSSADAAADQQ